MEITRFCQLVVGGDSQGGSCTGGAGIMLALSCRTHQALRLKDDNLEVYGFNWRWPPYMGRTADAEKVRINP